MLGSPLGVTGPLMLLANPEGGLGIGSRPPFLAPIKRVSPRLRRVRRIRQQHHHSGNSVLHNVRSMGARRGSDPARTLGGAGRRKRI